MTHSFPTLRSSDLFTIGGPVNSALLNFTKALAQRALAEGVRVNALCPGHIVTDRLHARIEAYAQQHAVPVEEAREALRRQYRSEEHTSELQSLMRITYAVFRLKKKRHKKKQ